MCLMGNTLGNSPPCGFYGLGWGLSMGGGCKSMAPCSSEQCIDRNAPCWGETSAGRPHSQNIPNKHQQTSNQRGMRSQYPLTSAPLTHLK